MIGYPTKQNPSISVSNTSAKTLSHSGRGMSLENDINETNEYYLETDRACIHKKPTPIQVVRVDYPNRAHARISEAYYKVPSTTDYNGVYRGKAIDFEAKQTKNKGGFPFQLIHPHQIQHMKRVIHHGGISFVILRFTSYNETYLIDGQIMIDAYEDKNQKSLSYKKIKEVGKLIQESYIPRLKYLDAVDEMYFQGGCNNGK
ncbi:Holliday junction resolvase RecU [Traorella massiliensis]|uniref:Holliday junction resolvase RecU n=1 Tax=Traorella massiliensis TaxID=1903263 RepID=UPI0008F8C5A0|nr:Holliday junction resolvase RecU [Traorella massiliensis]